MIKRKNKTIVLLISISFILWLFLFNFINLSSNQVYAEEVVCNGIKTDYLIGDLFTMPHDAQIKIAEEEYVDATECAIKVPDGKIYKSENLILKQKGEYQLIFSAKKHNKNNN